MRRGLAALRSWAAWPGLLLALLAAPVSAQTLPLRPAPAAPAAAAAASAPAEPASAALQRELAQVRERLARLQQQAEDPAAGPRVEEQRNLVARLAVLLAAQLQPPAPAAAPDAAALSLGPPLGAPPYAVPQLDALRDRIDALAVQRRSLELSARALEAQVTALLAARRRADENGRLWQDRLAQAREPAARERAQDELDLAQLESRVAAIELARADAARAESRERAAAFAQQIALGERELERARPHQQIDDAVLAQVADAARTARRQVQAASQRAQSRLARLEAAAGGAAPAGTPGAPQAAGAPGAPDSPAAREADGLRGEIAALRELDLIESGREEVWRQRRLALEAGDDAAQRAAADTLIGRSIEQLSARVQHTADRLAQVRGQLRGERLRLEALGPDAPDLAAERRAIEARQREADAIEAVGERLQRLQTLLARSREDLGVDAAATLQPWTERLGAALRDIGQAVWRYELFSVSDSTQVDGRTVTVDYGVTVGKSVGVVVLFGLGWWLASRVSRLLIEALVRRLQLSPQFGRVMHRWVLTVLLLCVLLAVLKLARIPLTAFAFLGGALAIGVGFGTQTLIKNLISGVIILFERKVRVGDIVTIDGVSGVVGSVDLRATTVRGFDGIEAIVPNSQLLENRVSNWSYGTPTVRRAIVVGLRYGDDARAAAQAMLDCARADATVLADPAPEVLFDDFASDAQLLRLQYWMRLGGARPGPTVDSDLRHAITEAFAARGLVIAFPQRDVHLRWADDAPRGRSAALALAAGVASAALAALAAAWPGPALAADGTAPGAAAVAAAPSELRYMNREIYTMRVAVAGATPEQRAERALQRLRAVPGEALDVPVEQVPVWRDGERAIELRHRDEVLLTVFARDLDADTGATLEGTAEDTVRALGSAFAARAALADPRQVLRGLAMALAAVPAVALAGWLVWRLRAAYTRRLQRLVQAEAATHRVLGIDWSEFGLRAVAGVMMALGLAALALISIAGLGHALRQFPATLPLSDQMRDALVAAALAFGGLLWAALPDVAAIALVVVVARTVSWMVGQLFEGVAAGRLTLPGVHRETARATRRLVVFGVWGLALAAAYPFIPGSDSDVFRALSVFLGAMFTLGSSGVVSQWMHGLVIVYARALRAGDFVRAGGHEGVVSELGALSVKIIDARGDEVTLPNSTVVQGAIVNHSRHAPGSAVRGTVALSLGYDVPSPRVHALLTEAAERTPGVRVPPAPRILERGLDDFSVKYELVVEIASARQRATTLAALMRSVREVFEAAGVAILSPQHVHQTWEALPTAAAAPPAEPPTDPQTEAPAGGPR